ncbi:MAG: cytochrome c oxidase subunit II [Anaerolineales bacterium]|nr:cytochrome c oxidase subunit II [Anaerolineales bacterium]
MNKLKHFLIVVPLTLLSTAIVYMLISGQIINFGLLKPPVAASSQAEVIDQLFYGHFVLISFLFSVIIVPMGYTFIVFRRRDGDESDGAYIHGNTPLEIAWTIVPLIFVVFFAVWGVQAYNEVRAAADNEMTVHVQGYKWDWVFYYPEMNNYFDENLYVPVNQPVRLVMQSRDVIHAFWVPEFRVKQDVMPFNNYDPTLTFGTDEYDPSREGTTSQLQEMRFTPTQIGAYEVRCAEICGTSHWEMYATVNVLSQADYDAWRSEVEAAQAIDEQVVSAEVNN